MKTRAREKEIYDMPLTRALDLELSEEGVGVNADERGGEGRNETTN